MEKDMVDFQMIIEEAKHVGAYFAESNQVKGGEKWKEEREAVKAAIDPKAARKLVERMEDQGIKIVVYSAYWCPDCRRNLAVLAAIQEIVGKELPVFVRGGIKTAPKDPTRKWSIPPSPPEMEELNVQNIPTFFVLNKNNEIIGRINENPTKDMITDLLEIIGN